MAGIFELGIQAGTRPLQSTAVRPDRTRIDVRLRTRITTFVHKDFWSVVRALGASLKLSATS